MRKTSIAVALIGITCTSVAATDALAWGDEGHKVVCEIAISQVKPSTRAAIVELIIADGEFDTFSDSCTWPDHPNALWRRLRK